MSNILPFGVLTAYIEGFGLLYSDQAPELFNGLPKELYNVSYDKDGPRYTIQIGHLLHSIIMKYVQWNPDSGKVRVILAVVDGDAHNRLILHKMSIESSEEKIRLIKEEKIYKTVLGLIENRKLIRIYALQQEKIEIDREINELLSEH